MLTTSASKLKTYQMCPRLYNWQYNLKLIQPENKALVVGTKYHELVEKFHNGEELIFTGEHGDKLKMFLGKYALNPVVGTIVDTEKRFSISTEGVTVNGILDRLDTDKIVEYKTSSFDYKEDDVRNWQTDIYIWWMHKTTGINYPMVYSVVNKTKSKTKKYIPQIITVNQTEEEIINTEKRLIEIAEKINSGLFEPCKGEHCSFCPYGQGFNGTKNCEHKYEKRKEKDNKV